MARPKGEPKLGGRVKGTPNKATVNIRDRFKLLIENNLEQIEKDLLLLKPQERIKAITELSKFCVPTLKSVDVTDTTPKEREPKKITFVRRD